MEIGYTRRLTISGDWVTFMLVGNRIIAYSERDGVRVHHVSDPAPEPFLVSPDGTEVPYWFSHVTSEETSLIVGRLSHPIETLVAFYDADWREEFAWGYVWNVNEPERSYWSPAERIHDAIDPDDQPQETDAELLAQQFSNLTYHVEKVNPRVIALATITTGADPAAVAIRISGLRRWLEAYESALLERLTAEQTT